MSIRQTGIFMYVIYVIYFRLDGCVYLQRGFIGGKGIECKSSRYTGFALSLYPFFMNPLIGKLMQMQNIRNI